MLKANDVFSSFSVASLEEAKVFYSEIIGLEISEDNNMGLLTLHPDDETEIIIYPKGADHRPASFTVLNFTVDSIDHAVDELISQGVQFEHYDGEIATDEKGIVRGGNPLIAWFKDPAGNILSLIQEN